MAHQVPPRVAAWLAESGWGTVRESHPVSGGCIHNGRRLRTSSGRSAFLKTNRDVPADLFAREAEGLQALAAPGCIRIPDVLLVGEDFLLLEDLAPASPGPAYWTRLGHQLAALHRVEGDHFGFPHDNYLGSTPQPNPWTADGFVFFAEHRLVFQAERAARRGLLDRRDADRVRKLAAGLRDRVPEQPASLIHGDLWSGNILSDSAGEPALIDPAAHYGWREAELAMMALFGSPPEAFYRAYEEVTPLPPGLHSRFPVYNLYHMLNHLNLFGTSYSGRVRGMMEAVQRS